MAYGPTASTVISYSSSESLFAVQPTEEMTIASLVVPPEASEEWVDALRRAGKTFEYKTYAHEPHGFLLRKTQLDAYARCERFLDWHLLP